MDDYSFLKPISSNSLSRLSTNNSFTDVNQASALSSSTQPEFKQMLSMMLTEMNNSKMSSFGLGDDSSSSSEQSDWGFSNNWMMPLMLTLMEKMLQLETQAQSRAAKESGSIESAKNASTLQINQFEAERQNGGDGINANCGPTSLVIALHALGLKVAGEVANTSQSQAVDLARKAMVDDAARDGIDENGLRADLEHNTFTNFNDLLNGAKESGAKALLILPNANSVQSVLQKGGQVIISGTFVDKEPLPWMGDSGIDNNTAPGFATQHIVAVTAYDEKTKTFTVNDPARNSPIQVDANTLEWFMSGNSGAMSLAK